MTEDAFVAVLIVIVFTLIVKDLLDYLGLDNKKRRGETKKMPKMLVHGATTETEVKVSMKLIANSDGVTLVAVDEEGDEISSILTIGNDGFIHRYTSVDEDLGLKLGDEGQVQFKKELR